MIKVTNADRWFGKCIKERAGWKCEACGKQYQEGDQGLHTSHFYSRTLKSVRHDPDNAAAHCFGCHQKLGGCPVNFAAWIEGYLGAERAEALAVRANKTLKIKKYLKEIAKHYEEQLTVMRKHGLREIEPWRNDGN